MRPFPIVSFRAHLFGRTLASAAAVPPPGRRHDQSHAIPAYGTQDMLRMIWSALLGVACFCRSWKAFDDYSYDTRFFPAALSVPLPAHEGMPSEDRHRGGGERGPARAARDSDADRGYHAPPQRGLQVR